MATSPAPYLISADQFLAMEFGPEEKVELDNGVIRMMGGGTAAHARVQANLVAALRTRLKGSGCRPYGSDMAVRTHDMSVRYPDVSVYCGEASRPERDMDTAFTDPRVVIEVLSPSTSAHDQRDKLGEYRDLQSVDTILFVDLDAERVRVVQRTSAEGWSDNWLATGSEIPFPALSVTLSHDDIFARD
jgi:Uma2 family endonuclease